MAGPRTATATEPAGGTDPSSTAAVKGEAQSEAETKAEPEAEPEGPR